MAKAPDHTTTTARVKSREVDPCLQLWLDHFNPSTQRSYVNFVSAFRKFLKERRPNQKLTFNNFTVKLSAEFRDYLVDQQLSESYANQIGVRFRNFYSYAVKQGWTEPNKALFSWVTSSLPKSTAVRIKKNDTTMLTWLRRIAALDLEATPRMENSRDLFIFAVITGGARFLDLRSLTQNSVSHGRLYWDNAGWSLKTNVQIRHYLTRLATQDDHLVYCGPAEVELSELGAHWIQHVVRLFRIVGNIRVEERADLPAAVCERALRELHYNTNDIAAFLLAPAEGSSLNIKPARPITAETRDVISMRLADEILDVRHHWYAVRLFDKEATVRRDIEESEEFAEHLRLYYPMDEVVCKRGKKMQKVQRPILHRIMFVQATSEHIDQLQRSRLMRDRINILRNRAASDHAYAIIPDCQIEQFSALVSNCYDIMDSEDLSEFQVISGDYVTITEGRCKGYSGRVFKVRNKNNQGAEVTMLEIEVEKIGPEIAACFGKKLYVTIPQRFVKKGDDL